MGLGKVQIGGRREIDEEDDIVSVDLTETCRNSSVNNLPNSR